MDNISELQKELQEIEKRRAAYKNGGFNIFRYMFNWHNEKYLHSSFIGMMISYKKEYLQYFIDEIFGEDKERADIFKNSNCVIYPNKDEHREECNIDLLILSEDESHAIIIENKLFAQDRFVNGKPQLYGYTDRLAQKYKSKLQEKNITQVYLSIRGGLPSNLKDSAHIKCISYEKHIKNWCSKCIGVCESIGDGHFVKDVFVQYLNVLEENINDTQTTNRLIDIIKKDPESAYELYTNEVQGSLNKVFEKEMNHIKWTVIEKTMSGTMAMMKKEWPEIRFAIKPGKEEDYKEILTVSDRKYHDAITKIAHRENGYGHIDILFKIGEKKYCLHNDRNGFAIDTCTIDSNLVLSNFEEKRIFYLICDEYREKAINDCSLKIKEIISGQNVHNQSE